MVKKPHGGLQKTFKLYQLKGKDQTRLQNLTFLNGKVKQWPKQEGKQKKDE